MMFGRGWGRGWVYGRSGAGAMTEAAAEARDRGCYQARVEVGARA